MKLTCPECGSPMKLRSSRYGPFYGCTAYPDCKATHGAHPDGKPLGTPADKPTKAKRIEAHDAFDKLWKENGMTRGDAYRWMQRVLNLSAREAHIGSFDIAMCERLISAVNLELSGGVTT